MNSSVELGKFSALESTHLTVPVISRSRFADITGVSEGVVDGWIARGYIPTYSVGKYTLINLAVLNRMALDKEFTLDR